MIYVVGSGFSGLTTAYALLKKKIKCTVISPSENKKRDFIPIIKYLLKKEGEIIYKKSNSFKNLSDINKSDVSNCKYILNHQKGGQSNIWGGVLGNLDDYNLKKFPINRKKFFKYKNEFKKLFSIIGFPKNTNLKSKKLNKNITEHKLIVSRTNNEKLRQFLKKKGVKFIDNYIVKKINHKSKNIELIYLKNLKTKKIQFKKIFISAGPIETSKIILNSFKINSIILKETRHFYSIIKIKKKLKSRFFTLRYRNFKIYLQLYTLKNVLNTLFRKKDINTNLESRYQLGQCYLNSENSGIIKIKKKGDGFKIEGIESKKISKSNILKRVRTLNMLNKYFEIKNIIFNKIGGSNHLGGSFPAGGVTKNSINLTENGELKNYKGVFISDSSNLNYIDSLPITTFSMYNNLRLILSNNKLGK